MELTFSLIVLFAYLHYVYSERHRLQFVYTVLTKPDGFSGPVFSAVGLCDDRRISHYSNEEQTWKRDRSDAEIWRYTEEPHESRDGFINLVNTLTNCTSSRCDGLHTLQRRIGCEWMEKSPKAKETNMKWNNQRVRRQVLKMELTNCMHWISTFNYSVRTPPALYMFASAAPHGQSKLILTCLATGFHPKHIEMNVTLNNITLQPFSSTGVRPNDNQTFQMRTSVEINRDDKQGYECHVLHSSQIFTTLWDGNLESGSHHWAAVAAGVFGIVVLCIMSLIYKNRR